MITDVIILAGGFGERLWPASSPECPKQFMTVAGNCSFLQTSIQRALALDVSGRIVIVTRYDLVEPCIDHCVRLADQESEENRAALYKNLSVLAEPSPKHTSAAVMAGTYFIQKSEPGKKHTVLVLASDHVINPVGLFVDDCKKAAEAAEKGFFVCYAIPPVEPAVGYGYIKTGKALSSDNSVFTIDDFKEKPDRETAVRYLEEGSYWWNSGMFAFDADFFFREMKLCTPEVYNAFSPVREGTVPVPESQNGIGIVRNWPEMEETYRVVPAIAIDKSVAEKTRKACAVHASFSWTDVGSWDMFSSLCTTKNSTSVVQIQSTGNFVYSDIPVALCGINDVVVVVKNGAVLVMKKGCSAMVRDVVNEMKEK